jgi:hypothetical protein
MLLLVVVVLLVLALHTTITVNTESFMDVHQKTIFISIASYRDPDCLRTVVDALKKADHPERLVFGICQQNHGQHPEENCVPLKYPKLYTKYRDNIRVITLPHTKARGPCMARYYCSTLYKGETYFMQIDSHTVFVPGFDSIAIQCLEACPNPSKSIVSYYPHDTRSNSLSVESVPVLCKSAFNKQGMIYFMAATEKRSDTPKPIPFLAGGFMMSYGHLLRDVPFQSDLDMLFTGEELLYSARAFIAGYTFYAPIKNVCLHYYTREDRPKFWEDVPGYKDQQTKTLERVKTDLGLDGKGGRLPPGERTLQQYLKYAGITPGSHDTTTASKFCNQR